MNDMTPICYLSRKTADGQDVYPIYSCEEIETLIVFLQMKLHELKAREK
jgi:hypothetical protein